MVLKKSLKNKSVKKSLSKKKLPSKSECRVMDAWHFPWNKGKYKSKCEEKGCIFSNSVMGSYCEDPITLTNRNLENKGLDS